MSQSRELMNARMPSLDTVFRTYATSLYRYAVSLLGNEADAEDALQSVFARLAARDLIGVEDVRAYLLRAIRNECMTCRRVQTRTKALPLVEDKPGEETSDADDVNAALAQLRPELRELVVLKTYNDMTFEAVAQVLAISEKTARNRYKKALARLRKLMDL